MRGNRTKLLVLVTFVVAVSALHYSTSVRTPAPHLFYKRLYYVPIVLGAFWFGLRGGLFTSLLASLLYSPHVIFQWRGMTLEQQDRLMEIALFNVIGLVAGALAQSERANRLRAEQALEDLNRAHHALKTQAEKLVEYEEELRRADRLAALGELSAGIAHEIRNPLGAIKGAAEIVADEKTSQEKRREFARILAGEVQRLNKVLSDFINFARSQPPALAPVDLNELLRDCLSLLGEDLSRRGIRVERKMDGSLPRLSADEGQLTQVFLNVILNAQAAMPEGGTLTVKTGFAERDGRRFAMASFSDTGEGIPKEAVQKIFDPFFTTKAGGAGLGLSVSHRIVENHGGSMAVNSRPGSGTTFSIYLPLDV